MAGDGRPSGGRMAAYVFILACAVFVSIGSRSAAAAPCPAQLPSPFFVEIPGELKAVVIDAACEYVYVANRLSNRIEVVSVRTGAWQQSIAVGNRPVALDISLDGRLLYVANAEEGAVSVVDLTVRKEVRKIAVPQSNPIYPDRPMALAVAANGKVLMSTYGSGGGAFYEIDSREKLIQRTDYRGTLSYITAMRANADRSAIAIMAGEGYPVRFGDPYTYVSIYTAATNKFGPQDMVGVSDGADFVLDRLGRVGFVGAGGVVIDAGLNTLGRYESCCARSGVAINPAGTVGYIASGGIEVIDLATMKKTATLGLGDTLDHADGNHRAGRNAMSTDGDLLAVITDTGLSLVRTAAAPTPAPIQATFGVCRTQVASPSLIPVDGKVGGVVIDDACRILYATNTTRNRVEAFSLDTLRPLFTVSTGAQPQGLDFSPDGKTLYVANSAASNISVIDIERRTETQRVQIPSPDLGVHPKSLAVAANGVVFVVTDGYMMQMDPRSTPPYAVAHAYVEAKHIAKSTDRSMLAVTMGSVYGLWQYIAADDAFPRAITLSFGRYPRRAALDRSGSVLVFNEDPSAETFHVGDRVFKGGEPFKLELGAEDIALDPNGKTAYFRYGGGIQVLDMATQKIARWLNLRDNVSGDLTLSRDGAVLAVPTAQGVTLFRPKEETSQRPMHVVAFSSANPELRSLISFEHTHVFDEAMDVAVADLATGKVLGRWTPTIAWGATQRFSIETIEAAIGLTGEKPAQYLLTIIPGRFFQGNVGHVVTHAGTGAVANLSVCDAARADSVSVLKGVQPSWREDENRTSISLLNNGPQTLRATVWIDGGRLGKTPELTLAPGTGRVFTMKQLEELAGLEPQLVLNAVDVSVSGGLTVERLVVNRATDSVSALKTVCEVPRQVDPP